MTDSLEYFVVSGYPPDILHDLLEGIVPAWLSHFRHENWALIRLLPLLIGHKEPQGDNALNILMLLKDIVELAVATRHNEA